MSVGVGLAKPKPPRLGLIKEAELEWFECLPFKEKVLVRVQVLSYKIK